MTRNSYGMDRIIHDLRNELAVAEASIQAVIDGKLPPNTENLQAVLTSLEDVDAAVLQLGTHPERQSLFNVVVEAAPNAMILVNQAGCMTLANAQAERLFGYTRDELLGQSIEVLVPERFRAGHPMLRTSFSEEPAARPMGAGRDLHGRRKDGREIPIEIGLNPVTIGREVFTLAAVTDITERKHAEELRLLQARTEQHAAEVEELNRELSSASHFKTEFVATMSHELRTPLTAIVGAAELLDRLTLPERARSHVETINEAAEALLSLINSILDFSKVEAGKLELQTSTFLTDVVLEGAAEVSAQLARERGVAVHTYVDPSIPPLEGDGDRLRQILLNLLGNAVKFTPKGHVVARVFPFGNDDGDVVLRFEVQDTGVGIPAELQSRLFEPFFQGRTTTEGGTGLGLAIAKRLVLLMGGAIGIESQPDAGSTFWFTARFKRPSVPASQRRTLNGIAGLIVSGDSIFAQIVGQYLTSWGMASRRATSSADVMDALQSEQQRWVAIVDLDDVGDQVVTDLVAVVRTSFPERIIAIGADGAVRKPVRQSSLFDAIVKAVDGEATGTQPPSPPTAPESVLHLDGPVLVAEDNVRLQRLLQLQFDELGVAVAFVSNGAEAIAAMRQERYAMAFMDCQMPEMDGFSATRAIRAEETPSGGRMPIVAMTANAFAKDRDACISAGMDDYLAKPVKLANLRTMIERWARRGATF